MTDFRLDNFTERFRAEDDVWVQNTTHTMSPDRKGQGMDLCMDVPFNGANFSFRLPNMRAPVRLTDEIPFEAIKQSTQLRHHIRRGALRLMTAEEAAAWYERQATRQGKTTEQVFREADDRRQSKLHGQQPLPGVDLGQGRFGEPKTVRELQQARSEVPTVDPGQQVRVDQIINPRVLDLCQQVSLALPPGERMPAKEMLDELNDMADSLTVEDLNHVLAWGTYSSVKRWAQNQATELARTELAGEAAADELEAQEVGSPRPLDAVGPAPSPTGIVTPAEGPLSI